MSEEEKEKWKDEITKGLNLDKEWIKEYNAWKNFNYEYKGYFWETKEKPKNQIFIEF